MDKALASNSRLQRLLWTRDYFPLTDEVILLESSFVFDKRGEYPVRMVQVGLTSSLLLMAEEKLASNSSSTGDLHRETKDCDSDLDLFEMVFLFPLENVRLSIRSHSEKLGNHIIRLRLCSGPTWYLELSDPWHREDKWHEWVWWIHELEQRRKREKKLKRHQQKNSHLTTTSKSNVTCPSSPTDSDGEEEEKTEGEDQGKDVNKQPQSANKQFGSKIAANTSAGVDSHKNSTAKRWVHHFAEHMIDHHDEVLPEIEEEDEGDDGDLLAQHQKKNGSSHRMSHQRQRSQHSRNPISRCIQADGVDSLSSLEDIQSLGSIVSSNAEFWTDQRAKDARKGILLSVGDLFGKVNFEVHAHGHMGRTRPMASMTRLDVLIDSENVGKQRAQSGIDKAKIHHTFSLPDILDGEAGFLEDLPNADDLTHHMSLVYLDLENNNADRSPHVINGHVMLLTKEQLDLQRKVELLRKKDIDDRLKYIMDSKKPKSKKINDIKKVEPKRKRRMSIAFKSDAKERSQNEIQQNQTISSGTSTNKTKRTMRKRMSIFAPHGNRRLPPPTEPQHEPCIESMHDINPADIAEELTAIDAELFLRIREAELIKCMWLKEERLHRAKNAMASIEFFKKVSGMVASEVINPETSAERANILAHILKVANYLRLRHNFHTLRAIVAGLQTPAVNRLRNTWTLLEEQFTEDFLMWTDLLNHVSQEDRSLDIDPDLDRAMGAPPCLPFLGSILMRIIDFYATKDICGTRVAHKLYDHVDDANDQSSASEIESAIEIVEGHSFHEAESDSDEEYVADADSENSDNVAPEAQKPGPILNNFLKKITSKVDAIVSKHSLKPIASSATTRVGMSPERKLHIKKLMFKYAKRRLEEEQAEDEAIFARNVRATRRTGGTGSAVFGLDSTLRAKLLEEFMKASSGATGGNNRSRHYAELHQMAHAHDDKPWKHEWTSEFQLHEAMLRFQLAAIQFDPKERNHSIREYLLRCTAEAPSGSDSFKLSLQREPAA